MQRSNCLYAVAFLHALQSPRFLTKFGGQPDWIRQADWPLSEGWDDRKMTFVGQIFLKKDMLENDRDLMVYIFMTQPEYFDDVF